jgi:hypothetical protein
MSLNLPPLPETVPRSEVYFPTPDDPLGQVHVFSKWREAETTASLLLVAIARCGVPIDLLDLPGTAKLMADHAGLNPTAMVTLVVPGKTLVEQAVMAIRETRELLDGAEQQVRETALEALRTTMPANDPATEH